MKKDHPELEYIENLKADELDNLELIDILKDFRDNNSDNSKITFTLCQRVEERDGELRTGTYQLEIKNNVLYVDEYTRGKGVSYSRELVTIDSLGDNLKKKLIKEIYHTLKRKCLEKDFSNLFDDYDLEVSSIKTHTRQGRKGVILSIPNPIFKFPK